MHRELANCLSVHLGLQSSQTINYHFRYHMLTSTMTSFEPTKENKLRLIPISLKPTLREVRPQSAMAVDESVDSPQWIFDHFNLDSTNSSMNLTLSYTPRNFRMLAPIRTALVALCQLMKSISDNIKIQVAVFKCKVYPGSRYSVTRLMSKWKKATLIGITLLLNSGGVNLIACFGDHVISLFCS